jgi:hypothetical protein
MRAFPCVSVACAMLLAGASTAFAADAASPQAGTLDQLEQQLQQQQQRLDDAQQKLDDQLKQLKAQEDQLHQQQQQINALKTAVLKAPPATAAAATPTVSNAFFQLPRSVFLPEGRALSVPSNSPVDTQTAQGDQTQSQGTSAPVTKTEPETRPEVNNASLASQGGVLTPKGVFSFEPSLQYQYTSNSQVLIEGLTIVPGITIGSQSVRQLVDRMWTAQLGGRLGITDRLEAEVEVPYVYRADDTTLQPLSANGTLTQTSAYGHDLGDIQFGAHYQINNGSGGWPYFVANILAKSTTGKSPFDVPVDFNTGVPTQLPTGTGFWAIQPSLTAIYPSDPVVFFGNLKYIYNAGDTVTLQPTSPTVGGTGFAQKVNLKPGDGIGGAFGMGFGINDKASFSLAYEDTYLFSTTENGTTIPGSSYDIGDFDLGFSYQLSERTSVNLGIQIGATKAAPDFAVILRIPIKFDLF